MKPLNIRLLALAAGALIAGGFGSAANADAPTFTVTPSAVVAGAPGSFVANNFSGLSSELLTITSATTVSGSGWVQIGQFSCTTTNPPCTTGQGGLPAGQTGLTVNYGLFIEFNLTDHLTGGSLGLPGSSYTLDSLNFTIVLDPNPPFPHPPGDTVTTASVSPLQNATVNDLRAMTSCSQQARSLVGQQVLALMGWRPISIRWRTSCSARVTILERSAQRL